MRTSSLQRNKQGKHRRQMLIAVVGAIISCALLLMLAFLYQKPHITNQRSDIERVQEQIHITQRQISVVTNFQAELAVAKINLEKLEDSVATGDPYRWILRLLNSYGDKYPVKFNEITPPQPEPTPYQPKVPYEAVRLIVNGSAFYDDFGLFLADFENNYPLIRIKRLDLDSISQQADAGDDEKLTFHLELILLVKKSSP